MPSVGRISRRLVKLTAVVATLLIAIAGLLLVATQTPWFRSSVANMIELQASNYLRGDLTVGHIDGNLLTGIELHDVALLQNGREVITAERIDVEYQPLQLLSGDLALGSLTVERPVVHLRRTENGLNLSRLLEARTQPVSPDRSSPLIAIDDIEIRDGGLTIGERVDTVAAVTLPERLTNIDALLSISRPAGSADLRIELEHLSFTALNPELHVQALSGQFTLGDERLSLEDVALKTPRSQLAVEGTIGLGAERRLDLEITSPNLSLPEMASLVPALESRTLTPAVDVSARGTLAELDVDLNLNTSEGDIRADVTVEASSPRRTIRGTVSTRDLNLAAIDNSLEPSDITATGKVDLAFESGRGVVGQYTIDASELAYGAYAATDVSARGSVNGRELLVDAQAAAYGGTVRAEGTITLPEEGKGVAYDLRGGVVDADLEEAAQALNLTALEPAVSAGGAGTPVTLDFHLAGQGSEVSTEVRLKKLSVVGARVAEGTAVEIGRRNGRWTYAIDGRVTDVDLRSLGERTGVAALTAPRYASSIDATVDLTGSGTSLEELTLRGSATLTDSRLFGGAVPQLRLRTDLVLGAGTISVQGRFSGLKPALMMDQPPIAGELSGTVDVEARISALGDEGFSFGSIDASGRIALENSVLAGIPIDAAVVAGSYEDRIARIATIEVTGPDLEARLSGRLSLDRDGASELSYYIDTPPLARVDLIEAPVHGEVVASGQVTGNLDTFYVNGTLSGTGVGYSTTSALGLHSTYAITIPDLSPSRATVRAASELTWIDVGGRTLTGITATATYADSELRFSTVVREAGRSLDTDGRFIWHPDHHEVHLSRLHLQSGTAEWRLAENTDAAIRYGGNRLDIDNLALRGAGDGRIFIDGGIGAGEVGPLQVRISSLDLAEVDSLLIGKRRLEGQLDVTADVTGSLAAPAAGGRFSLTRGAFESFTFESFGGTFGYGERALGLDARLTGSDGSWLTMNGRVPLTGGGAGGELDLRLQSSRIGLGLVQGFTDELTETGGTVQLDVVATGSYEDPHLHGYADIAGGAFTAVALGSRYTGLDTRVRFDPDVMRLERFQLLDDDGDPITIAGELAVHERQIDALEIRVEARDFEIMDNALGEIEVNTNLRISGEPVRLRVEGSVEVASASVRVDRMLELSDTVYDTRALADEGASDDPGVLTLAADVFLVIPNNLVLQGTDIQAPGSSFPTGLGNVNLTIGGDLLLRKDFEEEVELIGDVRPIRGTYEFQGREFEIQRDGGIVFAGTPDLNPTLNLIATRLISGVEARVHIAGTLDTPRLELSSQPPLDDADILSLIVFNRPVNQLGAGEQVSLAQRAASVAAGFVGSQLAQTVGEALQLDQFDIEVGGTLAPSIVIGEQFADGVFVKLRQQFGPSSQSSLQLEYELTDWLRLTSEISHGESAVRSLFDRSERGGVKLQFRFRY